MLQTTLCLDRFISQGQYFTRYSKSDFQRTSITESSSFDPSLSSNGSFSLSRVVWKFSVSFPNIGRPPTNALFSNTESHLRLFVQCIAVRF